MNKINSIKTLLLFFIIMPLSVYSQDFRNNKLEFSVSGGALLPGKIKASYESDFPADETMDIKNALSPFVKLVFDYNLKTNFSIGGNINFSKFNINDMLFEGESMKTGNEVSLGTWDGQEHVIRLDDIKMLEVNSSIKWRWFISDNIILKPCLYVGYRRTFSSSVDSREEGVVLNYNFEMQYYLKNKHFLLVDLGFISQPYGGVHHVGYVRSFGVPYFTIGYGISI